MWCNKPQITNFGEDTKRCVDETNAVRTYDWHIYIGVGRAEWKLRKDYKSLEDNEQYVP